MSRQIDLVPGMNVRIDGRAGRDGTVFVLTGVGPGEYDQDEIVITGPGAFIEWTADIYLRDRGGKRRRRSWLWRAIEALL